MISRELNIMDFIKVIEDITIKFDAIERKLLNPSDTNEMIALCKDRAAIAEIAEVGRQYLALRQQLTETHALLQEVNLDLEMQDMAKEEVLSLQGRVVGMEKSIKVMLMPKDSTDNKNAILEIRQGAGGNEAGLFAQKMLGMYKRFSENQGWSFEVMSMSVNDVGGLKDVVVLVSGANVFAKMKFESGTHRVQRVPTTENKGRVHTSTVTVAVLPELEDIDVKLEQRDLRVDIFRSSGPGGQSVNTTDSAVRITHIPTGLSVSMQDERSQIKNRERATKILRGRLYELEQRKRQDAIASERRDQIGTGERSEKIRTYNYPQNRITDHRINLDIHDAVKVVDEGKIDALIEALVSDHEARNLASFDSTVS